MSLNLNIEIAMKIIICQKFWHRRYYGTWYKIFTSGVLPGRVVPSSVVGVMEQNGYDCSRKKVVMGYILSSTMDYVITSL